MKGIPVRTEASSLGSLTATARGTVTVQGRGRAVLDIRIPVGGTVPAAQGTEHENAQP